jgi:hypothetical protein
MTPKSTAKPTPRGLSYYKNKEGVERLLVFSLVQFFLLPIHPGSALLLHESG